MAIFFPFSFQRQIEKGNDLLEEVSTFSQDSSSSKAQDENSSEVAEDRGGFQDLATSLRQHLGSFSEKLEGTRERIEDTAKCYQLMDKVRNFVVFLTLLFVFGNKDL